MKSTEANRNVESTMAALPIKFVEDSKPAKNVKLIKNYRRKITKKREDREFQTQWQDGHDWLQ